MGSKKPPGVVQKSVPMASGSVLIALASLRNTEAQLRWQGAQWAITLNASTIIALAYRVLANPKMLEFVLLVASCVVVVLLNVVWYNVLRRDGEFLDLWNKKILEHEKVNGVDGGTEIFCSVEYRKLSRSRNRLQRRLEHISIAFIIFWVIAFIGLLVSVFLILKGGAQL